MSTAWILNLVGYWMMRRMKRRDIHIFCFWITMLFNYQITCPFIVALTCIFKVTQPKDIPLFSEAQVLTILWASSLSLPFYLKVDWTWNNVASDEIINIIFFGLLLGPPGLNWWPSFALDFKRCCLVVQDMISTCHALHWICWVFSFASSWS